MKKYGMMISLGCMIILLGIGILGCPMESPPKTYSITFDHQGGTGGTTTVTATYGEPMPAATAPTRTGYTFGGYYTEEGGAGTKYYTAAMAGTQDWDISLDLTLYAKWLPSSYVVSFNTNEGTTIYATNKTVIFNQQYGTLPIATRERFSFGGWWTDLSPEGTQIFDTTSVSIASNHTLYAKWTTNTYTITYNANNSTSGTTPAPEDKIHDVEIIVMANTGNLVRTGYTFDGWNTQSDGLGVDYAAGAPYLANEETTLYAKWIANTYEVTLDTQGGDGGTVTANATYDSAMPMITPPTKTGYCFGGYFDQVEDAGTQYYTATMESCTNWNKDSNTILYAQWIAKEYNLTFNLQGGGSLPDMVITYDQEYGRLPSPHRIGYSFDGWWTTSDCDDIQILAKTKVSITSDQILYAKWIQNPLTYIEGGTFDMGPEGTQPSHTVNLDSFYIGTYEVTQDLYENIMGHNPSNHKSNKFPINYVSWYDAVVFCNALSRKNGLPEMYYTRESGGVIEIICNWDKKGYRLPTEAEWEYAARGGQESKGYIYSGSDTIDDVAWYHDNFDEHHGIVSEVGLKQPNELGLYDMSGNVFEWCWDYFNPAYYGESPVDNPRGPVEGCVHTWIDSIGYPRQCVNCRILRGGSLHHDANAAETKTRMFRNPTEEGYNEFGIRIVLPTQ